MSPLFLPLSLISQPLHSKFLHSTLSQYASYLQGPLPANSPCKKTISFTKYPCSLGDGRKEGGKVARILLGGMEEK